MNHVRPLGKRILAKIREATQEKVKGIIIQATELPRFTKADVVAVSNEVLDLAVGDEILIDRYLGNEVERDDIKYLMIREIDVIGKFN